MKNTELRSTALVVAATVATIGAIAIVTNIANHYIQTHHSRSFLDQLKNV